eukprot:217155_1
MSKSKKAKNDTWVKLLQGRAARRQRILQQRDAQRWSKKRKCPDESKRNDDHEPPSKKMRLEKPLKGAPSAYPMKLKKPLGDMTVSELCLEIRKRDENPHRTFERRLKKADLESILFDLIRLSPSQIHQMSREQTVYELKTHHVYEGRSMWSTTDLRQYLEYINSDVNSLENIHHNMSLLNVDNEPKMTKDEFIKIPLFKLQSMYNFKASDTNRNQMYGKLKRKWTNQRKRQQEVDKLLEPIINKFFIIQEDGTLCAKSHINADTDRVLLFRDLSRRDRKSIHQFSSENGLFSRDGYPAHKIIVVGDRTQVNAVVDKLEEKTRNEEIRKQEELRAKANEKWNKMIQDNVLLRDEDNDNAIFGEWKIKEDFGYGDKDGYYLYFNQSGNQRGFRLIYGSFLIGPIEGKLRIPQPVGGPPSYARYWDRKLHFDWRGRETGENVLQGGNETGEIVFSEYGTLAEGILHSDYGDFEFHALKISDDVMVNASESDFDYDVEEMYEQERVSRWGTKKYSCERARRTGGI